VINKKYLKVIQKELRLSFMMIFLTPKMQLTIYQVSMLQEGI